MFKWCSYCLHFITEMEPWHDYHISHGVCDACRAKAASGAVPDDQAVQELRLFFHFLQRVAHSGSPVNVARVLDECGRLRLLPTDLLLGVLQPLLVEMGELWAAGQVTVVMEHRFSALVGEILLHIRGETGRGPEMEPPRLLLFSAEDNRHTLGLQMAEPFFIANGVPTLTVLAGLPLKEVLDLLEFHKPEAVGFSVALAGQMNQVRKAAGRIRNLPDPPLHLLVGGPAVRRGLELDPALGIRACRQLSDVLSLFHGSLAGRVPIKRGNRGGEANPGGLRTSGAVPANVFLVDDDEDVLFLMTRVLRKGGVREVKSFAGGEASLQALRSGDAPDLIILDQNMPGMNGSGTLALIRRLRPDVPVLISSGQSGLEEWPEFNRPWVGVISKPFTMGEIQAKLAQFGG